jgi:DNA-binding FadR family transcriptional regulator
VTSASLVGVDRIRPAYEQVTTQLRAIILRGELSPGDRLPNEADLAATFGVSRTTIREALRVLTSQGLVVTERGAAGGTFVTAMGPQHVSEMLELGLNVLAGNAGLTKLELLESREILEVPAARLAAIRRTDDDLARLRDLVARDDTGPDAHDDAFEVHRDLHAAVIQAAHNQLLVVLARPVFNVLGPFAHEVRRAEDVWFEIPGEHAAIVDAIAARNGDVAAHLMMTHLDHIRLAYQGRATAESTPG